MLSAAFILAANSWMQHPVGYQMVNGSRSLKTSGRCSPTPYSLGYSKVIFVSLVTAP